MSFLTLLDEDSDSEKSQSDEESNENGAMEELKRKQQHPARLHSELWYNEKGEVLKTLACTFYGITFTFTNTDDVFISQFS